VGLDFVRAMWFSGGVDREVVVTELVRIDVSAALRSGVYLLSRDGVVVYVGQSKCPLVRIYTHRSLARKRVPGWLKVRGVVFDTAEVIPCHPDRINALEQGLIEFYKPVYNKTHNPEPVEFPIPILKPSPPATTFFSGRRL
jgi:hypothetical protein